jgi:RNA polymerase sigma-70 factor (ECF subfamily)
MIEKSDDELMQAIARGSEKAFASLYRRHSKLVLGYGIKILGSKPLGEDISQDVWMKVVKMAPSYQASKNFTAWLLTITRNSCFDDLRSQKNLVAFDEAHVDKTLADISKESILEVLSRSDETSAVQAAIATLPESQRTALILWMSEDLTYDDIAHQLQTTVAAVKSTLFRAREALSLKLRPADGDE